MICGAFGDMTLYLPDLSQRSFSVLMLRHMLTADREQGMIILS